MKFLPMSAASTMRYAARRRISRGVFGNCGLRYFSAHTAYNLKSFYCTHGAMGGTPWSEAGWDGKIYEDHAPVSKGMIILLGAASGQLPAAAAYVRSLRTNVTLEQESAGPRLCMAG